MIHIHDLDGCAPTPLAHYLKALGVLRLVAQQADDSARGWWEGDRFRLASTLDKASLEGFFLARYEPTPFVAPWNKGSGFFQAQDAGVTPIECSVAKRFEALRSGIDATRGVLAEGADAAAQVRAIKEEAKAKGLGKAERERLRESGDYKSRLAEAERAFKAVKGELIPTVRATWRGPHRDWIDAALVIDDSRTVRFPSLLGTGGNDGRLDFTNNFMQRLGEVFDLRSEQGAPFAAARPWLAGALWGIPIAGCLPDRAVGQFLPGGAGGANSVNGPKGDSQLNPFDFLLMMEGSQLFTASVTKRLDVRASQRAAAPFVVNAQAAGYASANASDESARGEQWMPLWLQPMTLAELRALFTEGRAQIGHAAAGQPLDMAQAASRLGVARGITAFQRFGYIERNGQSNLAVPLGRYVTTSQASPHASALDDIAAWLAVVRRHAGDKDATARLELGAQRLGDAAFDVVQRPGESSRWQTLLVTLGDIEAVMRTGSGFKAQPIPPLRPGWVRAADDGSPAFRLALALALQARDFRRDDHRPIDPVRRHWLPLDETARRPRFAVGGGEAARARLETRADVVMQGRSGVDDAIALVERRAVEAARDRGGRLVLESARGTASRPADLTAWLDGRVDADRTLALARALMAIDRMAWARRPEPLVAAPPDRDWPDDAWLCIRLACSPYPLPSGRLVPFDPAMLRRLASGDASGAFALAARRLQSAGLRIAVRATTVPPQAARRWAAALAFPISFATAAHIAMRLDPTAVQETLA